MKENTLHRDTISENLAGKKPIEIRALIEEYLRYWKWFLLGVVLALLLAMAYLKVTKPVYKAVASVILEDEKAKRHRGMQGAMLIWIWLGGLPPAASKMNWGLSGPND